MTRSQGWVGFFVEGFALHASRMLVTLKGCTDE